MRMLLGTLRQTRARLAASGAKLAGATRERGLGALKRVENEALDLRRVLQARRSELNSLNGSWLSLAGVQARLLDGFDRALAGLSDGILSEKLQGSPFELPECAAKLDSAKSAESEGAALGHESQDIAEAAEPARAERQTTERPSADGQSDTAAAPSTDDLAPSSAPSPDAAELTTAAIPTEPPRPADDGEAGSSANATEAEQQPAEARPEDAVAEGAEPAGPSADETEPKQEQATAEGAEPASAGESGDAEPKQEQATAEGAPAGPSASDAERKSAATKTSADDADAKRPRRASGKRASAKRNRASGKSKEVAKAKQPATKSTTKSTTRRRGGQKNGTGEPANATAALDANAVGGATQKEAVGKSHRANRPAAKASTKRTAGPASKRLVFPIADYDGLSAKQILAEIPRLSPAQCKAVHAFEQANKKRKTVLEALQARMPD